MADYNSKYSGEQVEALLDQVASGNAGGGGGGGIAVETDPIFSASPAATITENDKVGWSGKQDAISDLATIRSGAAKGATAVQPEDVLGIVNEEGFVTAEDLAGVATSGSYNDLVDKPTFKTINNESIEGSGNITISGGSGEQGPQGDKGDKGDTGVGVQSVAQTTTSNADGGSNVVTVTLTNGTKSTFTVKNGSKGSSGSNGTNGTNGKDGADGATFTPSVDSAGNLSWTNNKGLTNPPTVNIKGPKGDKGDDGEGGGSSGGTAEKEFVEVEVKNDSIIFGSDNHPNFEPNKVYYAKSPISESLSIYSLIAPTEDICEYNLHFSCYSEAIFFGILEVPSNWLWANGEVPTLENNVSYELSVVATKFGDDFTYKAVLTPFK